MNKIVFLLGLAVGYVLGSRRGRGAYLKLRERARDLWSNPEVQQGVHDAADVVREKVPAAADATDAAIDKIDEAAGNSSN